jgi:xyloglucan:xyloglucosyl transferase
VRSRISQPSIHIDQLLVHIHICISCDCINHNNEHDDDNNKLPALPLPLLQLSNDELYPGKHDEIDMELLGTVPGEPYTLQTNVYVRGTGDGAPLVGREMRFHLWFDPAADFHHYAILWNPDQIVFLVDDVPVRRYAAAAAAPLFPDREMWAYGSIWDASDWATDGGRYRADYAYQPFVARLQGFRTAGCEVAAPPTCRPVPASPQGTGLSSRQQDAMRWAQHRSMVYDYCQDHTKDRALYPEC